MKRIIVIAIALTLAGCASTEVMEYHAAPGQEIVVGKGGAMKVVNGIEVWVNGGTPPRAFHILAEATTNYQTGTMDGDWQKQNALEQLADEAKKRGADAVVIHGAESGTAGFVNVPGPSTTTVTGYGRSARAQTYNYPGVSSAIGAHKLGALFVKYEK